MSHDLTAYRMWDDDHGERCVVTQADDTIWISPELIEGISRRTQPPIPGAAVLDGDRLHIGTEGEGLGRLTYQILGQSNPDHRWTVAERIREP